MNWTTRNTGSVVDVDDGYCEHLKPGDTSAIVFKEHDNICSSTENYHMCPSCKTAHDDAEATRLEGCHECGTEYRNSELNVYRPWDFDRSQGDEETLLCDGCKASDKWVGIYRRNRDDMNHERQLYEEMDDLYADDDDEDDSWIDDDPYPEDEDDNTELMCETSPRGVIASVGDRIHNLSCSLQGSSAADELEEIRGILWTILPHLSNASIESSFSSLEDWGIGRVRTEILTSSKSDNSIRDPSAPQVDTDI